MLESRKDEESRSIDVRIDVIFENFIQNFFRIFPHRLLFIFILLSLLVHYKYTLYFCDKVNTSTLT